jgi:hypothetical protein
MAELAVEVVLEVLAEPVEIVPSLMALAVEVEPVQMTTLTYLKTDWIYEFVVE